MYCMSCWLLSCDIIAVWRCQWCRATLNPAVTDGLLVHPIAVVSGKILWKYQVKIETDPPVIMIVAQQNINVSTDHSYFNDFSSWSSYKRIWPSQLALGERTGTPLIGHQYITGLVVLLLLLFEAWFKSYYFCKPRNSKILSNNSYIISIHVN